MHGLGNDFVVIDNRENSVIFDKAFTAAIADRQYGVGCDQVLLLKPTKTPGSDVYMEIRNVDGTEAEACGNGTRCVAALMMEETGQDEVVIETLAGELLADRDDNGRVRVDMGVALYDWSDIPLAKEVDTLHIDFEGAPVNDGVGVNIGNPHVVFFLQDADKAALESIGPYIEYHPLLPKRANVEVVSLLDTNRIRMRVWERSCGITRACGSGACASAVAACRRGITGHFVEVVSDGGSLFVEWRESDGHALLAGATAMVFRGELDLSAIPI
tara:strand:- start:926 stop:1741 length:816 start_codon:yes stop_codon:yes gene_type:complete